MNVLFILNKYIVNFVKPTLNKQNHSVYRGLGFLKNHRKDR